MSERQLQSFISLALRHCCEVARPTREQVVSVLASEDDLVRAIATVGARRAENVFDLRRDQFQQRVQRLWDASVQLVAVC